MSIFATYAKLMTQFFSMLLFTSVISWRCSEHLVNTFINFNPEISLKDLREALCDVFCREKLINCKFLNFPPTSSWTWNAFGNRKAGHKSNFRLQTVDFHVLSTLSRWATFVLFVFLSFRVRPDFVRCATKLFLKNSKLNGHGIQTPFCFLIQLGNSLGFNLP